MHKQQSFFELPTPATVCLVPFGKFKNQPYEVLLTDADYALWLLSSMRAKLERSAPGLLAFLLSRYGSTENTPVHNRLQNRFLNDEFALRFALTTTTNLRDSAERLRSIDLAKSWANFVRGKLAPVASRAPSRGRGLCVTN